MSDKIMIVRHAEKPDPTSKPPLAGVDIDGNPDKESLIPRGWQRSGALACLFSSWGVAARPGLAVPATIYAAKVDKHGSKAGDSKSERPQETVSAAAAMLGLTEDTGFKEGDETQVAAAAIAATGPVLIAWQHQDIPTIANTILGNATSCPQTWPGDRFDMVWVFDLVNGAWAFSQVPQMVLAGDSSQPIN
ncbi:MAG TPA: hypothetical protein VGG29_17230 [Caulobacteraceae bacterium]|jgi:hypothetical protein